ncbi:ABC transporter permease [Falsochrobactrum shanghaiense]|uniref:ABC transporter permease n=1 Tax=Falsochrobactrum shanghaiense TaxID=2201899 RepID=A0A316JJM7_9HYPH|nr:ABC transporter permease [Falsochrobactrum shanghaiense]PWL19483.1 ABC transporter permease [Falsochrobactrum shanghaiense]
MSSSPAARTVTARLGRALLTLFVVAFFVFLLAPIAIVVLFSFVDAAFVRFPIESFSLRWYVRMIEYKPFLSSLGFSLVVAIVSGLIALIISLPAALSLARSRGALAEMVVTLLLAPLSMPMILLGVALLYYLSWMGLGISVTSLLIGHVVVSIPYVTRTIIAVYQGASPSFEESARILGATRWQVFRHVTLPLIRPGIISGLLFSMLVSLDNLPISLFFAGSTTNTLPVVMLAYQQNQFDPAIGAISTVQLLVAVVTLLLIQRFAGLKNLVSQNVR